MQKENCLTRINISNLRFNWTLATEVPVNGSTPKGHGIVPVPVGFTLETSL